MIFLWFLNQGFNFFHAGYIHQLFVEGFSTDTMNTIDNCGNIMVTVLIFALGSHAVILGIKKSIIIIKTLGLLLALYQWFYFSKLTLTVALTNFIGIILLQW